MRHSAQRLAKTTRPVLPAVVRRPRLFALLDRGRRAGVVWVAAPPGAGKTTLVSSWLEARRLPALWYRVDAGDGDVASLFYYLAAAVPGRPRRRPPLPLLTPEYLKGLPAFSRRYFEQLYARLTPGFVLVLDDYQEAPARSRFHEVVREALTLLPAGACAVLVSRAGPPAAFARLRASRPFQVVGWEDLRLTDAEAAAIARLRARRPAPEAARALNRATEGWAAGLILMLERPGAEGGVGPAPGAHTRQVLFDYFAGEILRKTDRPTRDFLLRTAFLPRMTAAMAERLTGSPAASRILGTLTRKNYFTARHVEAEPVYQYHPLFREFLAMEARRTFPPERLAALQRAAAAVLEEAGQVEDAAAHLREAHDLEGLGRLAETHAATLLAQGRGRTLEGWLETLPEAVRRERPWLAYWLGACRLPLAPGESLRHFEAAFERFVAASDLLAAARAWSGAVDSIMVDWGDFTRLDRWIAALDRLLAAVPAPQAREIEAITAASMFFALSFRQPHHPDIEAWTARALDVARNTTDPSLAVLTTANVAHFSYWLGDLPAAARLLAWARDPTRSAGASPLAQLTLLLIEATHAWQLAATGQCLATVNEALELGRTTGVRIRDFLLLGAGVYGALTAGDLRTARRFLDSMAASVDEGRLLDVSHHHYLLAWAAIRAGDVSGSLRHAERALALARETGTPFPEALCWLATAQARLERGEAAQAASHVAEALAIGRSMRSAIIEFMCRLAEAQLALAAGDAAAALPALRTAMAIGRDRGFVTTAGWRPEPMASLCAAALEAGIEVDYVQRLVRTRGLTPDPPPAGVATWPWPVRVHTLGPFGVLRDGAPVRFPGRAQGRPLALLKALVALGGRGVAEAQLAGALWPDSEGPAAHRAFATTLHRLRRLLGRDDAIELRDGAVTLDPRRCWVDAWAFERLCGEAERAWSAGGDAAPDPLPLAERAIALYRGAFLPAEEGEPWTTSMRERLRSRFLRLVARLGRALEQAGDLDRAADCYERGLDVDDCAEDLYRRLIGVRVRQGRVAEALTAYDRCRRVLADLLGAEPSPETSALVRNLRAGSPAVPHGSL